MKSDKGSKIQSKRKQVRKGQKCGGEGSKCVNERFRCCQAQFGSLVTAEEEKQNKTDIQWK